MSNEQWYLCGPMSGIDKFNLPLFDVAAAALRAQGLEVISPAELDEPEYRAACVMSDGKRLPSRHTYGELLARDIKLIIDQVGGLILLPGWTNSRGARLEVLAGLISDKQFAEYVDGKARALSHTYVRLDLKRNIP